MPTPCLWFDGQAQEAVDFYVSIFPNSRQTTPGGIMIGYELDGRPFLALDGGPAHAQHTPAISFVVNCADQAELDHYWDRLGEGGTPGQCGWMTDRFGVSWQVVPDRLGELMSDPETAPKVMEVMLTLAKLDIAPLEAAAQAG